MQLPRPEIQGYSGVCSCYFHRVCQPLPTSLADFLPHCSLTRECTSIFAGMSSLEELTLDFSDRDISNAAKFPEMMGQVRATLLTTFRTK